jgi:hypothetical protein
VAKAGRKRKSGKREANGRVERGPGYANKLADEAMAVVIEARMRQHNLTREQAKDESWGHTIGVLKNLSIISEKQAKAADTHLWNAIKYAKLKGWPNPYPKVATYAEMILGGGFGSEPDLDEINRLGDIVSGSQQFLIDALGWNELSNCMPAFKRYIIGQHDGWQCNEKEGAALRTVLNQLVRYYRV